jgi:hypothetical protein
MTLRIAQDYEYAGDDYWHWRAWIEGRASDLAAVESVKWLLHPSFTPSVVESTDRGSGFRLESSGWGTFVLKAELHRTDGSVSALRWTLKLAYPESETSPPTRDGPAKDRDLPAASGAAPPAAAPQEGALREGALRKVFLSYGAEDRRRAVGLRHTLESLGLQVVDDSQIGPGEPWELAARNLQAGADATIAYVSSDTPSQFVAREVNTSMQAGKPTLVIASDEFESIIGVDSAVPVARINTEDPTGISVALKMLKLPSGNSA